MSDCDLERLACSVAADQGNMSTSEPSTLPHRPGDNVETFTYEGMRNTNQGSGTQHNATQAGGRGNSQYIASEQHFHNHEPVQPQRRSFLINRSMMY